MIEQDFEFAEENPVVMPVVELPQPEEIPTAVKTVDVVFTDPAHIHNGKPIPPGQPVAVSPETAEFLVQQNRARPA